MEIIKMYELPQPTEGPFDIFDCLAIGSKFYVHLKSEDVIFSVNFFDYVYRSKGVIASLNRLPVLKQIYSYGMTKQEMSDLYDKRLVQSVAGRKLYNKIMGSAINKTCPLCSLRLVSTLDHYLPKAHYPQYALSRINLYPACFECNKAKLDKINNNKNEQTFHPYFDKLSGTPWLSADLIMDTGVTLQYYVNNSVSNDFYLKDRMCYHFKKLGIDELYTTYASSEFSSIKDLLQNIYNSKGADGIRKYLNRKWVSSSKSNKNGWKTIFYKTLMNSKAFCGGGFKKISIHQFP